MNKQLTVEDYMQMPWHYHTEATEWEGDKGFWVAIAELPDCSTFARSIEDGLAMLPQLLRQYLQVAIKSKAQIPAPKTNVIERDLSGKLLIRIPLSLHMGIKNAAKREHVSINQFALKALTEAVTKAVQPIATYEDYNEPGSLRIQEGSKKNVTAKVRLRLKKLEKKEK